MSFVRKAVERMKNPSGKEPMPVVARPVMEQLSKRPALDPNPDQDKQGYRQIEVDQESLRRQGFIAPISYERRLAEEYRHIKRPILAVAFGKNVTETARAHLVMVGSALSGEGKTTTCINLALSIAQERDRTVVLVDGDVAKPTVSRLFGVDEQHGLLDLLSGDCAGLGDALVTTDVPGLSILPAGKPRESATELLASDRMTEIVEELTVNHPNRIVMFDSPPLLATTESVVLGGIAGQIIVVVVAMATPREAVAAAVNLLDPDKAINLVLNKASRESGGDQYGYGYGYGQYGHKGEKGNDDTESA
jgi:exopolysaccharide/PEP-CTERM locus tyrosine autokinase